LVVAEWMRKFISGPTLYVGVSLPNKFFEINEKIKRPYVTFIAHPGWWKNSPNNYLCAKTISKSTDLEVFQIGLSQLKFSKHHSKFLDRQEFVRILRQTKIYISLSIYEGSPLNILEALCAGCYVIASDIPAHREIAEKIKYKNIYLVNEFAPINLTRNNFVNLKIEPIAEIHKIMKKHYNEKKFEKIFITALQNILS
ncbi:MAG: hypothetical protein CBB97_16185, partial [Candidatus Endolissoclinum sp. TMED37]